MITVTLPIEEYEELKKDRDNTKDKVDAAHDVIAVCYMFRSRPMGHSSVEIPNWLTDDQIGHLKRLMNVKV